MLDISKKSLLLGGLLLVAFIGIGYTLFMSPEPIKIPVVSDNMESESEVVAASLPKVTPIEHASFYLEWGDEVIYFDPVGEVADYSAYPKPTAIFITDIHGDHLNKDVIAALLSEGVDLIVPAVVKDELPTDLATRATVMENGAVFAFRDITITAVPMYNLPGDSEKFHISGRGNGYVLERDGVRVYNAGDTAGTPEMKALEDIDVAFVPMNLPYTMDIAEAAEAVLAFAPKVVYPFHYRGPDGLSDVEAFKAMVTTANPNIEVVLAKWYPEAAE